MLMAQMSDNVATIIVRICHVECRCRPCLDQLARSKRKPATFQIEWTRLRVMPFECYQPDSQHKRLYPSM